MRSESNNTNIARESVGDASSSQLERLSSSERIQRALEILWAGRISLLDFLIKIFDPNEPEHALYRDRIYTLPKGANSGKLAKFFDVIYEDKRSRQQLSHWMEPYAIDLVTKKVYSEMDAVKIAMRRTIDSITPGFLRNWNFISLMDDIANRLCPILYRILRSASQTESAKEKNTIKSGESTLPPKFSPNLPDRLLTVCPSTWQPHSGLVTRLAVYAWKYPLS